MMYIKLKQGQTPTRETLLQYKNLVLKLEEGNMSYEAEKHARQDIEDFENLFA